MSTTLDLPDIQGIVINGHGHLPHSCFVFLQIQDGASAKRWLTQLLPQISTAARRPKGSPKPARAIHIAFSASGLANLGLDSSTMQTFPREFTQGMGHGERTKVLGDTENSAPEKWQVGGPNTAPVDVLLAIYTTTDAELTLATSQVWNAQDAGTGLKEVFRQKSFKKSENEPFGFRDGISQPGVEGVGSPLPGQPMIKAGEFVLGYTNEYGEFPAMPTVPSAADKTHVLSDAADQPGMKELGRNGTFFVWRKLVQDVEKFWAFADERTKKADGTTDRQKQVLLAAKMVGRWPSGAPLVSAPSQDDPKLGADSKRNNNFNFMPTDGDGTACPIGSHIRRANPRDMLPPNAEKSLMVSNRHRLMRRGRPFEETQDGKVTAQGILFMAVNADIQRQFEFIQQTWLNNPNFAGLCNSKDPLAADNDGTGIMVIQNHPVRQRLQGLSRFVETKGGGYFFMPGIKALRFLAC